MQSFENNTVNILVQSCYQIFESSLSFLGVRMWQYSLLYLQIIYLEFMFIHLFAIFNSRFCVSWFADTMTFLDYNEGVAFVKLYVGCVPRTVTEEDVSYCFISHHHFHNFCGICINHKHVDTSLINSLY